MQIPATSTKPCEKGHPLRWPFSLLDVVMDAKPFGAKRTTGSLLAAFYTI